METQRPTCEFRLGQNGPHLRVLMEDNGAAFPITPIRHGDDIFFLAPDARVIAAFIRMAEVAPASGCAA